MSEMVWVMIAVFSMGHVTVVDNIVSQNECNILANKMKMVYEKEVKKAECFAVKKAK
jgi:hypothetical protein